MSSMIGNPALGPKISFLLGISELIKYLNIEYPAFLFQIFESDEGLFNNLN